MSRRLRCAADLRSDGHEKYSAYVTTSGKFAFTGSLARPRAISARSGRRGGLDRSPVAAHSQNEMARRIPPIAGAACCREQRLAPHMPAGGDGPSTLSSVYHGLHDLVEVCGHRRPPIVLFDKPARGPAQLRAALRIAEE